MLSATYQMSSEFDSQAAQVDPDNRLHWRANRRRLEAEAIRDSLLAVSGMLELGQGGTLLLSKPREYVASTSSVNTANYDTRRRSVYLPVVRSALYEVLQAFDFAEPSVLNGDRATTTVAPQALFMMNGQIVVDASRRLAEELLQPVELSDSARVQIAYERAYCRHATEDELARCLDFLRRYVDALPADLTDASERRLRSWQGLCRVLLAANEFIFVD